MTPHPISPRPVRAAEPVDGYLLCWRCEAPTDADGYCSMCGAVTVPVLKPALDPSPGSPDDACDPFTFDALVGPTVPGCEVCGLA